MQLVLASSSPFRKELLSRLGLPFTTAHPALDETPLRGETADALVRRLARLKAEAVAPAHPHALIIGSDQTACIDDELLGKPGDYEHAVRQLQRLSGQRVEFLTALYVINSTTNRTQLDVIPTTVVFRRLTDTTIKNYLAREPAFNCAGSFKSEGLGISLLEKIESDDPTALIGLPLICLTTLLENEGLTVLK